MFAEDLAPFFTTDDFAVDASAYNAHGVLVTFTVQMDRGAHQVLGGLVGDTGPVALCRTADVADIAWADGITVNGTAYTVATIAPDGTGVTTLSLREA